MTKPDERRAKTLSISLTKELLDAVNERVRSGMYTSASELVREALRLLLRSEQSSPPPTAVRFQAAAELMQTGREIAAQKIRDAAPALSEAEVQERLRELSDAQETGPGLRLSKSRLERLKLKTP